MQVVRDQKTTAGRGANATAAGVGDDQARSRGLRISRENVLEVAALAAHATRAVTDTGRRIGRLDENAVAQLLVDVIALHHTFPCMQVVVERCEHAAAWMDAKVAADLPAGVREALPLEHCRRVDRARGQHDTSGADLEASIPLNRAGLRIEDRASYPGGAAVFDDDAVDAAAADDLCAGPGCQRQIGDVHAELGIERTAESADTRAVTALRVAPDRTAAVSELTATAVHCLTVGPHDVVSDRADIQRRLDLIEKRVQLCSIETPRFQHKARRAKTRAGVDQRRPTDPPPDRQRDRRHADGERQSIATIETSQALRRRAGEIATIKMLALLEDDDLEPRLGQLFGGHGTTSAAPHDNYVGRFEESVIRLGDLQRDDARIALYLLIRLTVVTAERPDAVVRPEEHQDLC